MTLDEQLELFARYDADQLFTAATQLMRRIYDQVVLGDEEAVHGDLPAAMDDLCLGPWRELEETLVAAWPYTTECQLLGRLLERLEDLAAVSSEPRALEAVVTTRWLLLPSATPLWARG